MGDGSTYECARCGAPSGQYGHWRGGRLPEWTCDPEVYRAYQEWRAAQARQIMREIDELDGRE